MSTAIAIVPYSDIERMGAAIAKSGLFSIKTPEQAIALMLVAQAEGKHPAIVARDYDIIQGHPSKKAEAMLRDFLEAGGKVEWHTLNDELADATFSHPSGSARISWDFNRARKAELGGKDMWRKYPRQMLRSRVISEGVRTVWPMATSGMYVPEEVHDFTPATPTITEIKPTTRKLPPPTVPEVAAVSTTEEVPHTGLGISPKTEAINRIARATEEDHGTFISPDDMQAANELFDESPANHASVRTELGAELQPPVYAQDGTASIASHHSAPVLDKGWGPPTDFKPETFPAKRTGKTATEKQVKFMRGKASKRMLTEQQIKDILGAQGFETFEEVPIGKVNDVLAAIDGAE